VRAHTVVVGYDGSSDARRALDAACDHIADDGIVHVVTAFDQPSRHEVARMVSALPEEFRNTYTVDVAPRGYLNDAERLLEMRGVSHEAHFVDDHAASAILDVADQVHADLIVIGTRGLGRVERFLRGSVSARIANHARTSLMMVHHEEGEAA